MAKRRGLALDGAVARQTCGFVEQSLQRQTHGGRGQGRSHRHARPFRYRPVAVLYGPGDQDFRRHAQRRQDISRYAAIWRGNRFRRPDRQRRRHGRARLHGHGAGAARCAVTFSGTIEQIPPMYSALKRDGKPLYSMRGRVSSWSGRRARSRFTASSCCPCPGRRQRSMSHAVKARTSARWPRTSGARWVLCPPGGAAAHARRAVFAGPRRHAGRLAGHARPQAGIACIERIAGGPAAFKTLKDSL